MFKKVLQSCNRHLLTFYLIRNEKISFFAYKKENSGCCKSPKKILVEFPLKNNIHLQLRSLKYRTKISENNKLIRNNTIKKI